MSPHRDSFEAAIVNRAAAAIAAGSARQRPAASSARAWIDSLAARAQQRSTRLARARVAASAATVSW